MQTSQLPELSPDLLAAFTAERGVDSVAQALDQPVVRQLAGAWIGELLGIQQLVPDIGVGWRRLVGRAMPFLVERLSSVRLAPKLIEQTTLPPDSVPTVRFGRFITRMPGLQKLGQLLARSPRIPVELRAELILLEDQISDIPRDEVFAALRVEIGDRLAVYQVEVDKTVTAEASVSAVVGFSWADPLTGARERGVFKVLKPYVSDYLTEDLSILRAFNDECRDRRVEYGIAALEISEALGEVVDHLEREVHLDSEQVNLREAGRRYHAIPGVRIPRLIPELSTPRVTAMTTASGAKVTTITASRPDLGPRIAARISEALVAIPLFSGDETALFHADPHAGNLFYDPCTDELVILDWALGIRLTRDQRRWLVALFAAAVLRDEEWIVEVVGGLCASADIPFPTETVRRAARQFVESHPVWLWSARSLGPKLLNQLVREGVPLPGTVYLAGKILLTLEGVLHDLSPGARIDVAVLSYLLKQWATGFPGPAGVGGPAGGFHFPLPLTDRARGISSLLTFASRAILQAFRAGRDWQPPQPEASA